MPLFLGNRVERGGHISGIVIELEVSVTKNDSHDPKIRSINRSVVFTPWGTPITFSISSVALAVYMNAVRIFFGKSVERSSS